MIRAGVAADNSPVEFEYRTTEGSSSLREISSNISGRTGTLGS
jgi:hypothetical protein